MKYVTIICLIAACIPFLSGCKKPSDVKFDPNPQRARYAVEVALDKWKSGQEPGRIDAESLEFEVVDSRWNDGAKLSQYEITSEDKTQDGHHRFSVKMTTSEQSGEVVRYIVVGKNPLWVYREEDYKK